MIFGTAREDAVHFRICFVCTGNICRSPMAEVIFQQLAKDAGLSHRLAITSAGTGDWHVGEPADPRTVESLQKAGLDGSRHRAKQFETSWFDDLDLVIVFDRSQERVLKHWAVTEERQHKVKLLLSFDAEYYQDGDVPDPYYSEPDFFDEVRNSIERACRNLFHQIKPALRKGIS
ncbi:MAG: low molecular weight protein-tyrosine-phosphatase [Microbacteriaceae bacterium]